MIAEQNSCSPLVSNCSSTTSNSKTTPSTVSSARQNAPPAAVCELKPERHARPAALRLQCLSSPPRADPFFAGHVFKSSLSHRLPHRQPHHPPHRRPCPHKTVDSAGQALRRIRIGPGILCSTSSLAACLFQSLVSDVMPVIHALKMNVRQSIIGAR